VRWRPDGGSIWRRIPTDQVRRHSALAVVVLVGLVLGGYLLADAPAARAQSALQAEFELLNAPSGAQVLTREAGHKPGRASVGAEYQSPLSYAELRTFYDRELGRNGWRLSLDETLTDWGKDLGGHLACYRKADFWAGLQYAGNLARYGWDYGIDVTWGSSSCSGA